MIVRLLEAIYLALFNTALDQVPIFIVFEQPCMPEPLFSLLPFQNYCMQMIFIRSYVLKFSLEFSVSTVCTEFHITFHMVYYVYYVLCSD